MPALDHEPGGRTDGSAIDRLLADHQLIVASNRQPYSHEYDGDEVTVSRPVGGVTAALDPVLQSIGGTWVAWGSGDADRDVVDDRDHVAVPPEEPGYDLRRVWIDDDLDGYYYGFSNQVLWPLCHSFPTLVRHEEPDWATYRRVNERFADAVVDEVVDDPLVWFHDYHLALAPRSVRRRAGGDALLAHFWHIPWPSWDVFRRAPHASELLWGLLANDLIAFHTEGDRRHFIECVERCRDVCVDESTGSIVTDDGHETLVRAAPLPIDAEAQAERAWSAAGESFWRAFCAEHGLEGVRVLLGVERLDYTKGIEHRLDSLERLFEAHPEWRGQVTYVQKGSESRSKIEAYREVRRRVEERIAAINDRFGTKEWQPVVYCTETVPPEGLAALYRHADVALVSPLRDGMNLVAKEYVASQVEGDGVLVLSETAGAAEELGEDAITVTPLDTEGFAAAIDEALAMGSGERRRRMRSLQATVSNTDTLDWIDEQFAPLASTLEHSHDESTEYVLAE